MEVQLGENYTIEQHSSSSRCDPSRCSVRKSSALLHYPQNRRAVQPQMPREPVWMVHTIDNSEQHQHQQQMRISAFYRLAAPVRAAAASAPNEQL